MGGADPGENALVSTVHHCFAEHRPLRLSPDVIWLTIAQGFAQHVNANAETQRPRLVLHQEKERISVTVLSLSTSDDWAAVIDATAAKVNARCIPDTARTLVCDFSTTTPAARIASQIVLMDAFRRYFDYRVCCVCGIPEVTLLGTPEDWRSIRDRVQSLAEFDLGWWTSRLIPICDALIDTSEGRPSRTFWQSIYKPQKVYGGEVITGWIADLFPYVLNWVLKTPTDRNPILGVSRDSLTVKDGIQASSLPAGLSRASICLDLSAGGEQRVDVVGGLVGVTTTDCCTGCLEPEIGWAVVPGDSFDALLDALMRRAGPPVPKPLDPGVVREACLNPWLIRESYAIPDPLPAEIFRLLERADGPRLDEGRIQFRSFRDLERMMARRTDLFSAQADWTHGIAVIFADLPGDRKLAYMEFTRLSPSASESRRPFVWTHELVFFVGVPRMSVSFPGDPEEFTFFVEEVIVVARSAHDFFERLAFSPDALYFDAPDFVPDGSW